MTILLVEQNAQMALSVADRAYVLETGRVVMEGTGAELLTNERVRSAYLGGGAFFKTRRDAGAAAQNKVQRLLFFRACTLLS